LPVRSEPFALCLEERHRSQNQGLLKSERAISKSDVPSSVNDRRLAQHSLERTKSVFHGISPNLKNEVKHGAFAHSDSTVPALGKFPGLSRHPVPNKLVIAKPNRYLHNVCCSTSCLLYKCTVQFYWAIATVKTVLYCLQ